MIAADLATSKSGRSILHLVCIIRRPRAIAFHCAGITREIAACRAIVGGGGPLLPFSIAIAVAVMAWWSLR
jgi:hypothetical protein